MKVLNGEAAYGDETPTLNRGKRQKLSKRPLLVFDNDVEHGWCWWAFTSVKALCVWYWRAERRGTQYDSAKLDRKATKLMVGHTQYDFPPESEDFRAFIIHCLDIEAAFYDNAQCKEVMEAARKEKLDKEKKRA